MYIIHLGIRDKKGWMRRRGEVEEEEEKEEEEEQQQQQEEAVDEFGIIFWLSKS